MTASPLTYADAIHVLERLETLPTLVLIGGQALNLWAEYYSIQCDELTELAPFASQDIDFQGGQHLAKLCALSLGGRLDLPKLDDLTVNTAIVHYVDSTNEERSIDFVKEPFGPNKSKHRRDGMRLSASAVLAGSIEVVIPKPAGGIVSVRVMHPTHCLQSRVYNVVGIPGKNDAHGLRQLKASVLCAREHVRAVAKESSVNARKLNKRIFRFACSRAALKLHKLHGIDVFDSVCVDPALPERFRTQGYEEWRKSLRHLRGPRPPATERSPQR